MKRIILLVCLLTVIRYAFAQDTLPGCQFRKQQLNTASSGKASLLPASPLRSDTTDILHYTINLNITDFTTDTIRGNTQITFHPKINPIRTLSLDLLKLHIDSIQMTGSGLSYTYNDTLLIAQLPHPFTVADTGTLTVYYHGRPQGDASGWGGFYFQNGYAYNLGVGFAANPHNYGRVWHPCFDNFIERATYTFNISTGNGNISYCNGLLVHDSTDGSGLRTRSWELKETIPSYLACVAVGPYSQLNMSFPSLTGPKPVVLASPAYDTVNLKSSFIHLPNAFSGFENRYGPYRWEKIGYSMVPFTSGAMEHATNIAFPVLAANGSLTYEASLMAHELSHHWFGDLATCSSEEDMWLNEGWATYSQSIFTENVYGYSAYLNSVVANHENVLHYANWKEGGFLPVSGIPHQYTYGDHVYLKGADVAYTLRTYMGDSLFFAGLKYHLMQSQYKAVSSTDLRDNLIAATGLTNLTDFFNDWVFSEGWPHFSIDSFSVAPSGASFNVKVYVHQKLCGAPHFYNQVPLELTFKDIHWATLSEPIIVSGEISSFSFTLPINPIYAGLNLNAAISDAITSDTKVLKSTASTFSATQKGRMVVTPTNASIASDSAWIRIEHNYAGPDPFKTSGQKLVLNPSHYWRVDGIFPATFSAQAAIDYDGRSNITSGGGGFIDNFLLSSANLEDSIVLLYRSSRKDDWHLEPNITKNIGNPSDRFGTITINNLRKGEYALGLKGFLVGIPEKTIAEHALRVYPNPTSEVFHIRLTDFPAGDAVFTVIVSDARGRLVYTGQMQGADDTVPSAARDQGIYFLSVYNTEGRSMHEKLVIQR
jgi:aminopeptidase N